MIGRKGSAYYRFRSREVAEEWTGFSEQPHFTDAREVGTTLVDAFLAGADEAGRAGRTACRAWTRSTSSTPSSARCSARPGGEADRAAGGGGERGGGAGGLPAGVRVRAGAGELLGAILPKYVNARIYAALLESAASESASRRRAMKSATDNAEELIKTYTREANQARQAEITQEISEIVGGADALASAGSERS